MEQRHLVVAITAGTVAAAAACHLLSRNHSLPLDNSISDTRSALYSVLHISRSSSSNYPATGKVVEPAVTLKWDWAQSIEEVLIEIQVPSHVKQQDVHVRFSEAHLSVCIGQQCVISGDLAGQIQPHHSSWRLEGKGNKRLLSVTLCKAPLVGAGDRYAVWESLLLCEDDTAAHDQHHCAG